MRKRLLTRLTALTLVTVLGLSVVACNKGKEGGDKVDSKSSQSEDVQESEKPEDSKDDADKSSDTVESEKPEDSKDDTDTPESEDSEESSDGDDASDAFIADRTITIQAYIDDVGNALPDDLNTTPVGEELTRRTGIKLDVRYTPGESDLATMTTQLSAGNIPDVIVSYLNNSARPEFPILKKAADEGLFANVREHLQQSEIYSKYFEEDYLGHDAYSNIVMREDSDGTYLVPLSVSREDQSMVVDRANEYVGGMYIQKAIADDLDIDPREIRTLEQFRELLGKIKDGGYKDDNGQPVTPLGPKFWGGSSDAMDYFLRPINWGVSGGFNAKEDGTVQHEIQTEYALKKVEFVRELLAEGLIHQEYFTMDEARANEVSFSKNSAIIGDVHNYQEIIYGNEDWLPLGPLNDITGKNEGYAGGKGMYCVWAVSADAEKPEEIVKYMDYLSTKEGKLLVHYGIEGTHYDLKDGKPVLTEEALKAVNDGDEDYMVKSGASFGGSGVVLWDIITTDNAGKEDFGETRPGASQAETFAGAVKIAEYAAREKRYVPGLDASSFVNIPEFESFKSATATLDYRDTLVQAMYETDEGNVQTILDSYKSQLEAAGLEDYNKYLTEMYKNDPESLRFVPFG